MRKVISALLVFVLIVNSISGILFLPSLAEAAGNLITNGDFETDTGFTQNSIPNRFPSPFSGPTATAPSPNWTTADQYHKWFRATTGNEVIYSNIITDPENPSNKIARVMQTGLQGVSVSAGKTYELTFSAKADYAFQQFNISFADMSDAYKNSTHPILYPITGVVSATKTYDNGGTQVVENISPYNAAATSLIMPLETTKWATYKIIFTLGNGDPSKICAMRFACSDYNSTVGNPANAPYYLDNVSLFETLVINSTVETVDGKVGGRLLTASQISAYAGQSVTLKAEPYTGNTFLGWHLNNELQSTDLEYTFTASSSANYVAKFTLDAPVTLPREILVPDMAGQYKTQGRTSVLNNLLYLDYTASSFEFNANCMGDVKVTFSVASINTNPGQGLYFTVIVDGVEQNRDNFHITANGEVTFTLATGLEGGLHTFQIFRQNEISFGIAAIKSITLAGQLEEKSADKDLFIEFVGDSITAGYGNLTTNAVTSGSVPPASASVYQDGTRTYAFLTAKALNADISAIAHSGIGAYTGYTAHNTYQAYPYTRYVRDNATQWNFAKQPDIVVINLGTNDINKYLDNGKTLDQVKTGFKDLLGLVRTKNPQAHIIWAHGMMTANADTLITQVISEAGGAASKYYHVNLTRNVLGGGTHPTAEGHQTAANELVAFINDTVLNVQTHTPGDINGDGEIDLKDVTTLSRHIAGWPGLTIVEDALDTNNDGEVDLKDVTLLSRFIAGWEVQIY